MDRSSGFVAIAGLAFAFISNTADGAPIRHTASPQAGWQYAHWGMTPAQLVSASRGKAHEADGPGSNDIKVAAIGSYSVGDYEFSSRFEFKHDKLQSVDLSLNNSDDGRCLSLATDLRGKYGAVSGDQSGSLSDIYSWRDEGSGSQIVLMALDGGRTCMLNYRALHSVNENGL